MKWKKVLGWTIFLALLLGTPLYLSSDSFLTWICEKSFQEQWSASAGLHLNAAGVYKWTGRLKRAGDMYEQFTLRFPGDESLPEAWYQAAVCWRDYAAELFVTAKGNMEMIAQRDELRQKAMEWFDSFAQRYPVHPKAAIAQRAAQNIREGY